MFDRRLLSNFDWILLLLVMVISLLGVVAIYSASKGYPGNPNYWVKQLYWIAIGTGVMFVMVLFDYHTIGSWSYFFHGGVIITLGILLLTSSGAGPVARWFQIGPVAVQPSEFAKLSLILSIAHFFRDPRRIGEMGIKKMFWPLLMLVVPFFLIVRQPDLGTALMLVIVFIPLMVLAGVQPRILVSMFILGFIAVVGVVAAFKFGYYVVDNDNLIQIRKAGAGRALMAQLNNQKGSSYFRASSLLNNLPALENQTREEKLRTVIPQLTFRAYISTLLRPYQQRRLITFINPDHDPLGAGYHVNQSKVAIGSGGFFGKGYGKSTQGQLNFLPARHTDFLFSIFSEEWGFFGAAGMILLYILLIGRGFVLIMESHDRFGSFVVMGVITLITSQVFINLGMVVGLLPVVGVPLPLFSYGGSSLITMMMGLGLMLNIRMRRFLWD